MKEQHLNCGEVVPRSVLDTATESLTVAIEAVKRETALANQYRDERDKLAAECAAMKAVIYPIANEYTDCECTDRPVWYVVNPRQMMSPSASSVCSMFHGPFWSRERAEEFMSSTRYRYGDKASVFCTSLHHYPEMSRLFDASKNLETPATDAAIAYLKAQGVDLSANELKALAERSRAEAPVAAEHIHSAALYLMTIAAELRAGVK